MKQVSLNPYHDQSQYVSFNDAGRIKITTDDLKGIGTVVGNTTTKITIATPDKTFITVDNYHGVSTLGTLVDLTGKPYTMHLQDRPLSMTYMLECARVRTTIWEVFLCEHTPLVFYVPGGCSDNICLFTDGVVFKEIHNVSLQQVINLGLMNREVTSLMLIGRLEVFD